MKNLYLLLTFIALLTIVYFTQEKKNIDVAIQDDLVTRLVVKKEYGRLLEIQTPFNHLIRKNDAIVHFKTNFKVNNEKMDEFLKRIANIRSKKILKKEDITNLKDFFPEQFPKITFRMEKTTIEFRLGKKLDFSQDFYVEVITDGISKYAIAHDTTPFEGVVYQQKDEHRSNHKYERVKALFYLPVNFFMDLRIFNTAKKLNVLKFTNNRNKNFSVNFVDRSTKPTPMAGIKVSREIIDYLSIRIKKFEAESFIKIYDKKKLGKVVGQVFAESASISIHESYGNDNRYYITTPKLDGLFKIKSGQQRIFLFNVQNLWDLKPFDKVSGEVSITFDSGEKLQLGTHEFGLKANNTLTLLKKSAKYILDEVLITEFKSPKLQLAINGRNLEFHFTDKEIILVDRRLKISYHYERLDKKYISIDPDDYRTE